jgi:hypothetical protein
VIAFDAAGSECRASVTGNGDHAGADLSQGSTLVATPSSTNAAATETVNASINITTKNGTFVRLLWWRRWRGRAPGFYPANARAPR